MTEGLHLRSGVDACFLLRSNQAHEFHHRAGHSNYGNWGRVMDALHGTDRRFEMSLEHRRDRRLLGLTPVSTLVPSHTARENNNNGK